MSKDLSFDAVKDERCRHCPHNPNAEKPYNRMRKIDLDDLTLKALEKLEKKTGLNTNCIACVALQFLMQKPDLEEILRLLATK